MHLDQQNWCALQHKFPESPVLGYQATCWCTLSAAIFSESFFWRMFVERNLFPPKLFLIFFSPKLKTYGNPGSGSKSKLGQNPVSGSKFNVFWIQNTGLQHKFSWVPSPRISGDLLVCTLCGKAVVGRLRLADHMSRVHNNRQQQQEAAADTMTNCLQCGKVGL